MASRRQKQFERKYSSFRKYTATEDVNYSTHSSRSSYRSESLTSRQDGRGRSSSSEIVAGSETRSYPVYIAIQDYQPESTDVDAIALEQGQIVEVLDKKNTARWLVRTKARPPQSGWVPGSYFETPTEYYKQRRRTREIEGTDNMTEEQQATLKRDQVYHDLLNSEEEFVTNLRSCVDFYTSALEGNDLPDEIAAIREKLALNVHELYNFHANVLLKGLNYYSDDPGKVGQTFVRLERDFELHVRFFRELPETLKLLEEPKIREFFEARANTCEAGASSYAERLQQVADRMTQYQNFFKEFVKYAARGQVSTKSVQKALELVMGVPERVHELEYTKNITEYSGDTGRLGKLIRHDMFKVNDGEEDKERYVFMFKNKLMITERSAEAPYTYRHCATIRLDKYSVRTHTGDTDTLVLKPTDPGLPAFSMTPSDLSQSEFIRKAWLRDIAEEHEAYAAERAETETTEGETLALGSDLRSEFSEYTTSSRKSSLPGPEEGGPPRKKIKSPPVISPTGSTTSIYSGGSSSIDWTTTGTTLEMQGTRVTRTQYGFRTLQESSAKMCLKVTGYPLPDITWYKDDVQLHEDERHTFYADEDGFFAMTIDPVQVEDTGRYTCMATNEYGQASTSAFFRVLKVEKEAAPPKFVNSLRDQECKEGEVCSFECEVEGWPEPELVWLVDDQPLRPSHDFRLEYDGQTAKLEIRDAQPDDTGVYTVKIQNEFGEAHSKAELFVQPDPDKNHVAPEFQAVIEDVECREGDEVRFKAVVTGDPNPDITWLINGYPLSESEKVKFISEDGICILTIKDVTRHFDGIVTCQATNRLGTEQCTARLRVIVPPAPPTFNKPLEDKTVVEKNSAVFEVDVAGWPEPSVVFTLKGKELKHGEDGVEITGADGYYRVVINNCSQDVHEGEIVAKASNEHGTAESRARLTVEQPEEDSRSAPTFLKDIEDQTVKHGEWAVFETTVSGSPNPEVSWYINGHKMDESSPGVKIEVVNHDHKLTIDSAHYAGTVLCRAENVVGRFETKARLVVLPQEKQKKPPRFVETLHDITETEQNTVVFEVRVEGEPVPTVQWFLNGKELVATSERVEIREFDGSIKLELRNISLEDAGEIKCVATNSEGTAETSSKLTVKRKPFPPSFDKSPQSLTIEKGESGEFTAHAEAEPAPEYQWSVDGRKIRESTEGASFRVENGIAILVIDTKIFSQSCTVSVTAENSLGVDETGARLTVSEEAEKRRKEEEERKRKEEEEAKRKAEEEEAARKKAEEEEAARKKAEEEEAARKKAEEDEAARKKAEEDEAARKKAEEEEAARKKAEEEAAAKKKQEEEELQKKVETTTEAEQIVTTTVVTKTEETTTVRLAEGSVKMTSTKTSIEAIAESEATDKEIVVEIETSEQATSGEMTTSAAVTVEAEGTSITTNEISVSSIETATANEATTTSLVTEVTKTSETEVKTSTEQTPEMPKLVTPGEEGITVNVAEEVKETTTTTSTTERRESMPKLVVPGEGVEVQATEVTTVKTEITTIQGPEPVTAVVDGVDVTAEVTAEITSVKTEVTTTTEVAQDKVKPDQVGATTVESAVDAGVTTEIKTEVKTTEVTTTQQPETTAEITMEKIEVVKKTSTEVEEVKPVEAVGKETTAEISVDKIEVSETTTTTTKTEEVQEVKPSEAAPKETTAEISVDKIEVSETTTTTTKTEEVHEVKPTEDVPKESTGEITVDKIEVSETINTTTEVKEQKTAEGIPTKKDEAAPKVTRELTTQTVSRGDLAHFEAVIEHATTVRWYHKGKEVTSSSHGVKISQDEHFEFRLSLDSSVFSEGEVSIVGENSLGTATSKCELKLVEQMREFKKPEFTDKLKDMDIVRDEPFQMDVIALNSPQYKWYINGKELKSGVDGVTIVEEGNKSSLRIEKALPEHEGAQVRVTATNEVGTSESQAKLTIKEKSIAPVIHNDLQDVKITEGSETEYKVKVTGSPEPRVMWYVNEKIVEHSETTIVSREADEYSLKLTQTKVTQSGTVRVTAQNSAGSDKKESNLVIVAQVRLPVFSAKLEETTTIKEQESHTWEVKVDGAGPGTTVKWYVNGKELTTKEGIEVIDKGDGTHKLSAKATPDLQGTLTVKVTNEAGEAESSTKVTVLGGEKKPEFTKTPQNHETTIEESVKFSAVVEGTPTPQVSWFLNGKKLEHSEAVKVKHDAETGKTSIRIHKPQIADSGEVKVTAENSLGKVEATAELKVDRKTEVPKFTTNMDDRQVNEGTTVKYTSTVEGYPVPTVEWTLNGEPVSKHPNIKISDDGNQHTIEISEIKVDQAGELSCQASNAVGLKKQNVQLAVKMVGEAPTFAKNLEDRLVTETELTLMEAKLNDVKPKPKITWLRDGKEFTADDHWKLEERDDGTLRLQITTTEMTDKSRITIKAENYFGAAECSASLGVVKKSPMAKPAFQSDIAPISLNEGDSLQTKVLITGNPTPFVKWYINGQLVCETEDTEITNANGVYSLTIHGVSHDMTGKIKCTAYNKAGEVTTEGTLKVTKPIPVEFETSLCDATCREGDTLKLKAVLLGEPTPEVSWYVNGKKLEESQNIKIHAEKGTYTVTIKDITCDYSGKVVCEAVNEYGKASSEAMLLVLPRGEPPDFLEWLSNVRARQGSKVVHKVVFTGDPRPVLTWYINNKEVTSGGDITIVTDDKTSILTINNFNPEKHVGEIICKAENDAGEVSCTANMATYTSDMFSESESEAQMEEFEGQEAGAATDEESLREEVMRTPTPVMAPKFITKIKDAKAKKGHEAIFECVVPDTKGVVCKWLKDGKEIELIARIRVQTRTGPEGHITQELVIDDVQPEDVGKYTVVVENSAGRDVCEATLTIIESLEKPSEKAPEFTANLQDRQVFTSDKVVFECKVVGEPKPAVSWYHEQVRIEESSTVKIETSEDVQRLIISTAEIRDEGKYSCVAENTAGSSKTEAVLQVKAELPEFTKHLQNVEISTGEKLVFSCSVKGSPQPHVEFFRESTRLSSSERISVEHDKTNTHWRVVISEVTKEELNVVYKAVATNTAGSVTSEAKATQKQTAPVFEQGLKKTSVKEKEEIRMEVKVSGTAPEVEFFKDGEPVKEDSNHQISKNVETGSYTLVIKESTTSDAGKYTAKATNPAGTAESSAEAEVEKALTAPSFAKELTSVEVKEKNTTSLSVTVQGVPAPEVTFIKDGSPVKEDSNHQITKNTETGSYTLTIKESTSSDAGKYTAKAVNTAGTAESTATVTVTTELEKPSFVKELTSVEIKEKSSTTLSVTVKGVPAPEVTFIKDGSPIKEDSNHQITKNTETGSYTLTIKESTSSDAGKYTAKAVNTAGTAESTATVTVTTELEKPSFVKELTSVEIKEKSTTTLSVTVKGVPAPEVTFVKDGSPVKEDSNHQITKDSQTGSYTLTIKESSTSDAGKYTAKAVNTAGTAESTAEVTITKEMEKPSFVKELTSIHLKEKTTATLSVIVKGVPAPDVTFLKDGSPVKEDSNHQITKSIETGDFTLVIKETTSSDAGKYSAKAVNAAGTAESVAEVTISHELEKPSFVKELVSVEIKEKSSASLSVTVKGVPAPDVEWQKDGKPVDIDGTHIIAKTEGELQFSLTVNDARKEDAGHYTAKAVNKAGEATSECDVKIAKISEGPKFTEELRPMEVKETETLRLSVTVQGEPVPTITWKKDGRPIEVDGVHLVAKDEGNGHFTLTVNNARTEDVGIYSCTATNDGGSATTEAKMGVIEDVVAPHFVEGLKPLETEEGKPVELSVTVEGKPEPEVVFMKDGVPVNMDNQHEIKKDSEGHHVLVIKKVSASDEGKYSCVAQNKAGKEESIGELKVPRYSFEKTKEEQLAPFFVEPLKEATAVVGETVALECRVNAESKPEIKWFKEGRPVTPGPHLETTMTEDGLVRLVIHGATAEDIGAYRCEAVNKAGSAQTTAELKYAEQKTTTEAVEESVEMAEMRTEDMAERATATTAPARGPPEFVELLRSCTVSQSQTAVLKCKVSGEPRPKIRWTKDGKEVEMSARVKTEHKEDGTVTLTIDNADQKDAGEYRCEAENELGSAWSEAPIVVTQLGAAPIDGEAPDFLQPIRPAVVEEGETALLEGKISGKPTPTVKWYKNGEHLKPSDRVSIECLPDGTQRLVVKEAQMSDMDEYRCEASNEFGDVWSDVTLTVKEKHMEAPEFVKELRAVAVVEGKKAEFECKVKGIPKPEVKWFKDGEELVEDSRLHRESSDDGTEKLVIETSKIEDQGNYKVEATNAAGQMSSKAPLTVTPSETLKIKKGLEDVTINKGMKILLTVEVEGKPKTVKWYKGSEQISSSSTTKIERVTDHEYKLEIASGQPTDVGSYRVVLSTESVSVESSCTVTVTEGDVTPTFKKGLSDQKVPKGAALVLEVEVDGKPKAVKWYKGDQEIPGEDLGNGKYRLTVPDFKEEDIGKYKVVAENDAGKGESSAKIDLADDGKDKARPEIVSGLIPTTVSRGETATFTVKVKGPVKAVKWYKNGKEITDAKTSSPEDGTFVLEVPNAQKDDAADYKVVVSNDAGDADSAAALTVKLPKLEIAKGLEDQAIPKGEDAVLEVKTNGKPKQVKWYKNGKEISPSDKAKPEAVGDDTFRLKVPKMDDDDVADYKVVLVDDDGNTAESACALTVKLPRLEITKGLEDQTVEKGKKAILEVRTNGKPKSVKWYKNGKEIAPGDKAKPESEGDNTHKLVIPDAGDDDAADYKVVLTGEDGTPAESSCALTVKLPRLEITKGLEDQEVEKGKKAVLEVKTNGKPKQVKWYKNGKEIRAGDKPIAESHDDNTHKLVIPDADDDDVAEYKVVLTGDDGTTADSSCALTVKLPAEQPRIVKELEDQVVPVGSPLVLEITTSGSPKIVRWYKNGRELAHAAGKINVKKIDDNNYVLEIPQAAIDDTGDFKVEVENEAGKAQSQCKVTVEPQLTFVKGLKDQEVVEGENAEFKIETNARPRSVKWYKNGQEIKPDAHFVLGGDDKTYTLTIKGATKEDAAQFKVVLSNSAGDVDSSAKLTVKKPKPGAPRIVKGLDDQVVAKGAALIFEVKVDGEVDEVRWTKDASPVGASAVIEKIDANTYRLTVPNADLPDAGHYAVELINEGGKAKSDAKGEVDEKPEIVKGLQDAEVEEGDDDVFKVEVSAPVRTVKWYKNGQELKPSAHFEPKKIGPKKFELAINKAQLDDGAEYKVVLSNAAGECDSSAALTVTRPNILKLLEGLKDIDVDEGNPLELKVKVQGTPKSVKWYKNGQELTPSDRVTTQENPESGEYSLTIPKTEKADGAAYRVVLANDKGEVYSGCVAHVKAARPASKDIGANMLTPLKDTEVEEGETLTLTCKVEGEPFPEIVWEKDGVRLEKSERISMRTALDGTVTLRVRDCKKTTDIGQYRVTATNSAGTATSACSVTVTDKTEEPSKPHFVIPLATSCSATVGEKKEFSVKVRGFPKPTLKWILNGETLVENERIVIEDIGAGNYCLTIKDVRESDFGTLRCVATNEKGSDECTCLFEQSAERPGREAGDDRYPPRFNVPLWDRRIPAGDPLSIECHVDAKPTADISWFKDGKTLVASERIEIRNTADGACRVRIDRFTEEDTGVYLCVAKNELGQADTRSTYSVEVLEREEEVKKNEFAPRFNPGLEDKTVNAGQPVRISCQVTAEPRASVVWYKDGLPLRSDGRITLEYGEDGSCSLSIADAKESDEGAYRCVATNEHGATNTSCLITVKSTKTEAKKEGEEPFFTKNLIDAWTDRGDTFTLKCAVKGDPFPEIKWYRNGQLVRNSPRCVIETAADGSCSLTVKECTMSDEGIYRCEAENKLGKAKTQATAHVQMALGKSDKPKVEEGQPPRFITPLEDMTVTVGGVIDLECKVTGQPMPHVKWSKDGGPLWEDPRYEWDIDEAKGTYKLRIRASAICDEGTYRCVATNESGSATTKAFVRIDDGLASAVDTGKALPPRFTIKLGDARATEGQPLKLECKIEGFPLPELTWHKDGAQIRPSDRVEISLGPDGVARLVIPQCNMDDEGIYRVIATNPSGSAHDKGNATVKRVPKDAVGRRSAERDLFDSNKAPKLLEPLENVKVPEKEGFRLRCKWSGDPKPTVKWFKDGERVFPYGRLQLLEHDDGVCELIIDSSIRHDAGGYRCVAENSYGSARTTCDVFVIPKERKPRDIGAAISAGKAPGFTIPLTIRRAKPGDTVVFECLPFGTPFPAIKWLKDGIELVPGDKYTMESLPDGTQKLTIKDIDFISEGYYRCVATNEHGTASTKAELCVDGDRSRAAKIPLEDLNREPEESKPRIRRGLYNMSIHQGNVVEMIVCATGWPTPTVKWYKDGEEIISDGPDGRRVIFTDERGIHHLVILNCGPEDEGEYSLEATNKLGSAKTEGALNIIRPRVVGGIEGMDDRGGLPFPPGFVRQLKNKHVFNHMPTIFDCLVVGHPPPDVEWFHNGKKIVPGGRIKIQSCGGGSHAIIIMDTTIEDAGEYVAIAKNSHGTASSSAILDVTVPYLDNIKFNGEIDVTPYLTEEYGFKKINVASLPTPPDRGPFIKEVTGHYLTLSWIPTKRAPPRYPQVTYVIEIRELPEKEWTLLDYNIPEPVCKVRNLELGKSYQFRVRAENIYGISDPSPSSPPSRLMAPPQPVLDKRTKKVIPLLDPYAERALDLAHAEQYACAPWFAPGVVEKRFCAENDTLTLILNVSGYPDPTIQWKFRGWDIDTSSPTSKCKVYTYGGTETTLTIVGFNKENVGQYQCVATNAYGEAQQNIMVDLATRPSFIQPLMNKTFSSAHPMRLDVRVEGQPFPELKWMKEWRPIVESSRIKFVQDGPYLCSLIINDPMWRDSGIYSCVAVNDAGQATTSCSVTVEADGDYNDVELPKKRVSVEARKVREIYEIEEEDEK